MAAQSGVGSRPEYPNSNKSDSQVIQIDLLRPADTPRLEGEDEDHAQRLAESEIRWPPILVHKATMRVIDGMHRLRAAKIKGQDAIEVEFFDGSEEAAFVEAVRANTVHGLPLSMKDRHSAALRIMFAQQDISDRAAAECTGLSAKTISRLRESLNRDSLLQQEIRVGKDGRRRPLSAAEGRQRAADVLASEPTMSLRQVAKIAGVSLGTAHDVKDRMRRGESPVASRGNRRRRTSGARAQVPTPVRRPTVAALRTESKSIQARLESLGNDPSLKFSESGRKLLRWLYLQQELNMSQARLIDDIPTHLVAIVAEVTIQCADMLQDFAGKLQERENRLTNEP